jgi:hypothetical protein
MNARIHTLTERATALLLAAIVTLTILGSIDNLAQRDLATDSLLVQQASVAMTHA